jgi:hypothetical protein
MGLEILIGLLQFAVSVLRFFGDWWDRRRRSPAELLRRTLKVKEEVNGRLWTVLAETNGDAIIREVRRKDTYPDLDDSLRSISPWFKGLHQFRGCQSCRGFRRSG